MMHLPDELVHSNLTMSHSLGELPKKSPWSMHSSWLALHLLPPLPLALIKSASFQMRSNFDLHAAECPPSKA